MLWMAALINWFGPERRVAAVMAAIDDAPARCWLSRFLPYEERLGLSEAAGGGWCCAGRVPASIYQDRTDHPRSGR